MNAIAKSGLTTRASGAADGKRELRAMAEGQ